MFVILCFGFQKKLKVRRINFIFLFRRLKKKKISNKESGIIKYIIPFPSINCKEETKRSNLYNLLDIRYLY